VRGEDGKLRVDRRASLRPVGCFGDGEAPGTSTAHSAPPACDARALERLF
jgi:hypothetical protein